jgi:hypothetical protein
MYREGYDLREQFARTIDKTSILVPDVSVVLFCDHERIQERASREACLKKTPAFLYREEYLCAVDEFLLRVGGEYPLLCVHGEPDIPALIRAAVEKRKGDSDLVTTMLGVLR